MARRALILAAGLGLQLLRAAPAAACDVALLLTIDVSGSIDRGEYRLQVEGLAAALDDPEVAEALLLGQAALGVVQWSGTGRQTVSIPWRRMLSPAEVADFARRARDLPRAYTGSDTAVGEAIAFSVDQFAAVSDCRRKVIDISGDGPQNAGAALGPARGAAAAGEIEINAIAIEDMGRASPITEFYRRYVVTRNGFVVTARGLADYPRAIREKILREVAKPLG
jgi:Ca-activated chloride channel family protein